MLRRQAPTKEYLPPEKDKLETSISQLGMKVGVKTSERQELYQMIKEIERVASEVDLDGNKKHRLMLAAGFVCLESGRKDKTKEYNKAYFEQTKATFPREMTRALDLNENNTCGPRERLQYLTDLFEFVNQYQDKFIKDEASQQLTTDQDQPQQNTVKILKFIIPAMSAVLGRLLANITIQPNVIPTEEELDNGLSMFYSNYLEAKKEHNETPNPDRVFLAQIASLLPIMLPRNKENRTKDEMERSLRIKIGSPVEMLWSINSKGSNLYLNALSVLNLTRARNIEMTMQIEYLSAFKSFIADEQIRRELERLGDQEFGEQNLLKGCDAKLDQLKAEIEKMIDGSHQNMTVFRSVLSCVGEVTGLTAGATTGLLGSQTVWGLAVKQAFCDVALKIGVLTGEEFLTFGGGVLLSFAANQLAVVAMVVGLAVALSKVGKAAGTGLGMGLDFSAEVSYEQLQKLCCAILDACQKDEKLAKHLDKDLIHLLQRQPKAVFDYRKNLEMEKEIKEFEDIIFTSSPTPTRP